MQGTVLKNLLRMDKWLINRLTGKLPGPDFDSYDLIYILIKI
jgi:hypothetical protein